MRLVSPQGNASRISRESWRRTKLATELIIRVSDDKRPDGSSSSRLNVKRLISPAPKKASKSRDSKAAISLKSSIMTTSRRPIAPFDILAASAILVSLRTPSRRGREEIKDHEGTAGMVDANLEKEREERQHQSCREPADQYFADLDPRLGTIWKVVVTVSAHSQNVNNACEQADSAMRQDIGHWIADRQLVGNPARDARQQNDECISARRGDAWKWRRRISAGDARDSHHQDLFSAEISNGQRRLKELATAIRISSF